MQDPPRENITGQKKHVFKHEVNWGYVAIGAVVILLLWYFDPLGRLSRRGDDREESADLGENAVEVALTG